MMTCSKCGQPKTQAVSGRWYRRPCDNAYQRAYYQENLEQARSRNRESMAQARRDPMRHQRLVAIQRRAWENGGRERNRAYKERRKRDDFFGYHTQFVRRFNKNLTKSDLIELWEKQGGLCGLTGRPLTAEAGESQIDHVVPQTRGGSHDLSNLRWVITAANLAKRDMTDDEFVDLCVNVAEWIGRALIERATGSLT